MLFTLQFFSRLGWEWGCFKQDNSVLNLITLNPYGIKVCQYEPLLRSEPFYLGPRERAQMSLWTTGGSDTRPTWCFSWLHPRQPWTKLTLLSFSAVTGSTHNLYRGGVGSYNPKVPKGALHPAGGWTGGKEMSFSLVKDHTCPSETPLPEN